MTRRHEDHQTLAFAIGDFFQPLVNVMLVTPIPRHVRRDRFEPGVEGIRRLRNAECGVRSSCITLCYFVLARGFSFFIPHSAIRTPQLEAPAVLLDPALGDGADAVFTRIEITPREFRMTERSYLGLDPSVLMAVVFYKKLARELDEQLRSLWHKSFGRDEEPVGSENLSTK